MKSLLVKIVPVVRWPLLVIVILYSVLVIYRIPAVDEERRTVEAVAHIDTQKITMSDVMGSNVPPVPDPGLNDRTVAGIDANHNDIRDDVELALFKKYPDSIKIRAAELQYARALQVEMTEVFNSDTWVAAVQEEDRGYQCIGETYPRTNLQQFLDVTDARSNEVENLVFNTQIRKDARGTSSRFTTSFGLKDINVCDIDLATL